MIVIFCTSHLYIPATLYILSKETNDICICSDLKSVVSFIHNMYPDVYCYLLPKTPTKGNLYHNLITRVYKAKQSARRYFSDKKIDKVFFFHEGYCEEVNWLIKYLWKKNHAEVYYMPVERTFEPDIKWDEPYSIKLILKKIYCYLCWGYWVHYYKYMNYLCPVMDSSFFKSVHSKEIPVSFEHIDIESEINKRLLAPSVYPKSGVVWLENTLRLMNVDWSNDSYNHFLEQLLPKLSNKNVFFKGHPDQAIKYGCEIELIEIPSFIPGNLLLKRFSCFIGVISDLMSEVAEAGTMAISTLYLFDIKEDDREMLVGYLKERSEKILFPRSISELMALVESVKTE